MSSTADNANLINSTRLGIMSEEGKCTEFIGEDSKLMKKLVASSNIELIHCQPRSYKPKRKKEDSGGHADQLSFPIANLEAVLGCHEITTPCMCLVCNEPQTSKTKYRRAVKLNY
ncbi:hypothetical protein QAD02_010416 [Eretmocerus hayati]|uniref:Uncharacterized protein n=1 Tax=Eretmocerus hayati TaxID=131215 RepID=A0ACC2NTS8_9HYME|nr:hypothetical protein QAD02_010416 [Eretmocerus hayati]